MMSLLSPHNLSSESAKSLGLYNLLHFPLGRTSDARGHKYVHRHFGDRVPDKAGNWCPRLSSGLLEGETVVRGQNDIFRTSLL